MKMWNQKLKWWILTWKALTIGHKLSSSLSLNLTTWVQITNNKFKNQVTQKIRVELQSEQRTRADAIWEYYFVFGVKVIYFDYYF
jgi:hypothetical protein